MAELDEVLERPGVIEPLKQAVERDGIRATEPAALAGTAFALCALAGFVVIVLEWGDRPGTALPMGIVGLVLLAFVQVVVLRRSIFRPSTVADIIRAFVGDKGLAEAVAADVPGSRNGAPATRRLGSRGVGDRARVVADVLRGRRA
jgi:hypothetical protein